MEQRLAERLRGRRAAEAKRARCAAPPLPSPPPRALDRLPVGVWGVWGDLLVIFLDTFRECPAESVPGGGDYPPARLTSGHSFSLNTRTAPEGPDVVQQAVRSDSSYTEHTTPRATSPNLEIWHRTRPRRTWESHCDRPGYPARVVAPARAARGSTYTCTSTDCLPVPVRTCTARNDEAAQFAAL